MKWFLIGFFGAFVFIYLLGCMMAGHFNPSKWDLAGKIGYCMIAPLWAMVSGAALKSEMSK